MVIPSVSQAKIAGAIKTFDRKHRNTTEFCGWEHKGTQRYAIVYNGRLYPPKMIISLAAGIRRSEFSGGYQSNSYLEKRGFKIIDLLKDDVQAARTASCPDRAREGAVDGLNDCDLEGKKFRDDRACLNITLDLYSFQIKQTRYNYLTTGRELPRNGIYFFFEKGEQVDQGVERIVRVGTHKAGERFRGRIRQHYGSRSSLKGNKNASVFRKHVGGALLSRENPHDERLQQWLKQGGRTDPAIEARVSACLRQNFTFCCFSVEEQEDRLGFERGIIALLAKYPLGRPSAEWLGRYAHEQKIGRSGLWNSQQLEAEPLSQEQMEQIRRMSS